MSAAVMAPSGGTSVAQGRPSDPVAFIAQLALDERIDGSKLQILWDLQKDILAEQRKEHAEKARVDFFGALADAQGKFPVIEHDAKNPHTGSTYARLETIWAQCCPIWTKHGFAVTFEFKSDKGLINGVLRLSHRNGHVEVFHTPEAPPDSTGSAGKANKTAIQGNQSTMSYLKRGLLGNLGIVTAREDDDGAGGAAPTTVVQRRGRDMPPVGREDPIDRQRAAPMTYPPPRSPDSPPEDSSTSSAPPRGSMRETAQDIERRRDQKFLADLALEFADATTEQQVNEISSSLTGRAKMPAWMQEEIHELEVDALERIRRREQDPNESDESGK